MGRVVPERSGWQIRSVRRRKLPEGCQVKAPAFFNPALVIDLVKAWAVFDASEGSKGAEGRLGEGL